MTTPRKRVVRYPAQHARLFRPRWGDPTKTVMRFSSHSEAIAFRAQLYGYRTALLAEPEFNPELARLVRTATFAIRPFHNGHLLTISIPGAKPYDRNTSRDDPGLAPDLHPQVSSTP